METEQAIEKTLFSEICKIDASTHTVMGVVLVPETTDLQGDIVSASVIRNAAHDFLAFSRHSQVQHVDAFVEGLDIVESYIAPAAMTIDKRKIKKGSWLVTARIRNDALWTMVESGKLTGFSIGGMAATEAEAA